MPSSACKKKQVIVNKLTTSISAVSGTATYGGTATLYATLTHSGTGLAGKTIRFKIGSIDEGTAVICDVTGSSTLVVAKLTGVTLPGGYTDAYTYSGAVSASFDGSSDSTYGSSGLLF